jgi:YebC/PmpR family DNA-binding regulatory protein
MSGHSKWHNIRVRKTAQDAVRGKIYTRHARLIEMAARAGGGELATNPALRSAIDNAKADRVPNANIDRAVKKGTGETKGEQMAEVVYAAYGPGGAACLIECLTDNTNRTLANVKMVIHKHGGNWADSASVTWMFHRKGVVSAHKTPEAKIQSIEEMELDLIDFGAEDVDAAGDSVSVTTDMGNWTKVRDFFRSNAYEVESAGLKYVPTQKAEIKDLETAKKLMDFVSALEEDEDVSEVYTNADFSEEVMARLHE